MICYEQMPIGDLLPVGVSIEALGGDYDSVREGSAVLDEVQGVARSLGGVADEDHRLAVRYPDVQRSRDPELRAGDRDAPDGLGGRLGQGAGISWTDLRVAQPVEEEGEDRLGVRHAEEPRVGGVAQGVAQGAHGGGAEALYRAVVGEEVGAGGERRDAALLRGKARGRASHGGEDGRGAHPGRYAAEASVGPDRGVRPVDGGLAVYLRRVPAGPEPVRVHHPTHHLLRRIALNEQGVLRFQDERGERYLCLSEVGYDSAHLEAFSHQLFAGRRQLPETKSLLGTCWIRRSRLEIDPTSGRPSDGC